MRVAKCSISNNPYIGAFATTTEDYTFLCNTATKSEEKKIEENLQTRIVKLSINGSNLAGIYTVANSNGVIVPSIIEENEYNRLKNEVQELNISIFDTNLNALKNNILANDKLAIINPEYSSKEERTISEILGVETIKMSIGSFKTVGANNIMTNRGIVLNNKASEEENEFFQKLVHNFSNSTANLGSLTIGLSVIANSKGIVAGEETTGFELSRIEEALESE